MGQVNSKCNRSSRTLNFSKKFIHHFAYYKHIYSPRVAWEVCAFVLQDGKILVADSITKEARLRSVHNKNIISVTATALYDDVLLFCICDDGSVYYFSVKKNTFSPMNSPNHRRIIGVEVGQGLSHGWIYLVSEDNTLWKSKFHNFLGRDSAFKQILLHGHEDQPLIIRDFALSVNRELQIACCHSQNRDIVGILYDSKAFTLSTNCLASCIGLSVLPSPPPFNIVNLALYYSSDMTLKRTQISITLSDIHTLASSSVREVTSKKTGELTLAFPITDLVIGSNHNLLGTRGLYPVICICSNRSAYRIEEDRGRLYSASLVPVKYINSTFSYPGFVVYIDDNGRVFVQGNTDFFARCGLLEAGAVDPAQLAVRQLSLHGCMCRTFDDFSAEDELERLAYLQATHRVRREYPEWSQVRIGDEVIELPTSFVNWK